MKLRKRIAALLMTGAMVCSTLPVNVWAVETTDTGGLCEHHPQHTADCGYTEGSEGTPCSHEHTEDCYTLVTECVHEHTAGCYPTESVSENTATPSDAEDREPTECTHECSKESGCITKELDCQHKHDEVCGYAPATVGTPCGYICEICNPQDSGGNPADPEEKPETECICETVCTVEEVNADCPVCGMEGADLTLCKGKSEPSTPSDAVPAITVESVQAMIDALPAADELRAMTKDEQNAVYADLQAAYEAYNKLTDGQKTEVTGAEMFESLFNFFNGMVNALATVSGVSYLDEDGNKKTQDNVTVVESSTTTWNSDEWYVVNKDVTISDRVTVSGTVHLILADGYTLDAKSGIDVPENSHLLIYAQSTGGSMGVLNATGSGTASDAKAGIGGDPCGSVTINGGKINAKGNPKIEYEFGAAGIGGGHRGSDVKGTITINGGDVTAIGVGYGCGIGAAYGSNSGGTIEITGGSVVAKSGNVGGSPVLASGIGGGNGTNITISGGIVAATKTHTRDGFGVRGDFSANGNGVIFADSFSSTDNSDSWNGVIFQGTSGKVYAPDGNKTITITDSFEIPSGYTLEIPEGVTLVIPEGVTLTNNGTISGDGTLMGAGVLAGSGSVTVAENGFRPDAAVSVTFEGDAVQDSSVPYGSSFTIRATISEADETMSGLARAGKNQVYFYVVKGSSKNQLGWNTVSGGSATLRATLTGENWKPDTYTITAEYGGSDKLKPASGTAQFTVTKAEQTGKPTVSVSETAVDSITVSASGDGQGGYEYACVPGANSSVPSEGWTTSGTFSGLSTGTAYTVFARFAGDEYYKPSPASEGATAYTLPEITTDTLDQAVVGVEYSDTLAAQAAEGTKITWSLVSGLSLPDGLELSEDGTISGTPKEAVTNHKFTVQATANGVSSTKELSITAAKGTAVIDLDAPGEETREFTYGDTITVSGTITASSQAPAANALTAPASNQAALFLDNTQLTEPVTVGADGKFTITYDTADKGIQATGQEQTLTVKYGGSDDLNAGETSFTITLNKKPVTAEVQGEITKVYDGNSKASVNLGFASGAILSGDTVNVSAPSAAYGDEKAGTDKTITLGELTVSGEQAGFYDVKPPEGPIYGSITVSGSSLTAEAEESELTYGDTLTITVTPKPTGQAPANTVLLDGRQGVELFYGDTSLATAAAPDENGAYTLTYDTAGKGIPIGEGISLTVQFYGDGNMAVNSTTATISLSAKPVTATVDTPVTKVYDKSKDISLTLSIAAGDLENPDDEVVVTATGTFDDENAAPNKTVTVGELTVKGKDAGWYMVTASAESVTGSITAAPITKPTIDASSGAKPGDTLKAVYTPGSGESVDYTWKRGGEMIQGATNDTYTIQLEDVGKEITVTVSAQAGDNNHVGSQTSDSITPGKGIQNAPPKPEEASVTTSSITVKEIEANQTTGAAVEFSIDDGKNWQTSTTFDGLSSGSEYNIIARYQETDAYNASPASKAVITTDRRSSGSSSSGGSSNNDSTIIDRPDKDAPTTPTTAETKAVKTDSKGNVVITKSMVDNAISAAQADARKNGNTANGVAVVVPVEINKTLDGVQITLKADALDKLVSSGVKRFTINTDGMTDFGFTLDTLKELNRQTTGDLILKIQKTTVTSQEAKAAIGSRPAYDITLWYVKDGKETQVTSLNGKTVSIAIPYTPATGESAGNLYAVYVDGNGKIQWLTKSSYNADQKAVIFEAQHFSIYGVGYKNPVPNFTDISGHWAREHILFTVSRGLFSGTSETTFSPNTTLTRGMFVTALGRLAGINPADYQTGKFTDVKADAYYAPYVNWATKTGIVSGTTSTTFAPDSSITREQMAVILKNYADKMGYSIPKTLEAVTFADNAQISSWAKDAVKAMQQAGVLSGKANNLFDPKGNATRAEAATVLHRFVEVIIDPQTANGWTQNNSGEWSYYKDGEPVKGWLSDEQKWYWLDKATGKMFSGGWKQIDGKWYYFYADGSMAVNTKVDGYEVGANGARITQ